MAKSSHADRVTTSLSSSLSRQAKASKASRGSSAELGTEYLRHRYYRIEKYLPTVAQSGRDLQGTRVIRRGEAHERTPWPCICGIKDNFLVYIANVYGLRSLLSSDGLPVCRFKSADQSIKTMIISPSIRKNFQKKYRFCIKSFLDYDAVVIHT